MRSPLQRIKATVPDSRRRVALLALFEQQCHRSLRAQCCARCGSQEGLVLFAGQLTPASYYLCGSCQGRSQ